MSECVCVCVSPPPRLASTCPDASSSWSCPQLCLTQCLGCCFSTVTVSLYICVRLCVHTYMCICVCECVCPCVSACVRTYVCLCLLSPCSSVCSSRRPVSSLRGQPPVQPLGVPSRQTGPQVGDYSLVGGARRKGCGEEEGVW